MHLRKSIARLHSLLISLPLSLKIVASTGIIISLGIASSDWFLYQKAERMLMASAWDSMQLSLMQQSERITQYSDRARHDAIFLSHSPAIQQPLTITDPKQPTKLATNKSQQRIENLFSALIEEKGYLQIRLIDLESGKEVVRVNRPRNDFLLPDVTKKSALQNKKDSLYVKIGSNLKREQVYVSDINLNQEHGKIAEPHQPTQRFVVGVFEEELMVDQFSASHLAEYIRRFDLELTTSTLRAVQTGNLSWQEHYNYNAPRLDLALERARLHLKPGSRNSIDSIISFNQSLVKIEFKTFDLVAQGKTDEAESLIMGKSYLDLKKSYKNSLIALTNTLENIGHRIISNQKPKFIIVINTNFQDVLSSFRSIKTHETLLVNKSGQFLYHHDKDKQFSFEFTDKAPTLINEEPQVWSHLSKGIKESMTFDEHGELHVSQRIFFDDINHDNYIGLILAKNKKNVLAPAIELGQHASIVAVIAISLSLFSIFYIIRRQTRPITELTNHAVRISNGDLNDSLPSSDKKDEVGRLTSAFSNLIIKLQDQNKSSNLQAYEIKELNRDLEKKINERTASLKEASIKAESASTAKSEFLATMSHEIRTPLNGMLGMAQILSRTILDSQQDKYVKTINSSGKSLLTIINDILDFSKIESGKLMLEPTEFYLKEICHDAIQLLMPRANDKKVHLILDYHNHIPKFFYGDTGRIRQVILNLLGNAVKFTSEGSVTLTVSSEKQQHDIYDLTISVKDTGIGIPEKDQAKLFGVFQQADASTTRKFGGTGLGLAICKKLIELMDGEIGLNSTEAKGSEFWFKIALPEMIHSQKPDNANNIDPSTSGFDITLEGHILLVEDNQINQLVAQDMIERTGLTVDIAENGIEAIASWRKTHYDIILMDCLMPEMDGYEATRQIRLFEKNTHIPIIALTANVLSSDKQACKDAGMDDFIGKPIELTLLNATLEKWIKGGRSS
jgi:signal transduction histidine kinase/CheY-like chemotaxis protein